MTPNRNRQREDHRPIPALDLPPTRDGGGGEDDHDDRDDEREDEREPEAAQDLGHLEPEVGPLDLLLRRAPRDVVAEEVREQRLGEVDREPAEEEEAMRRARSVTFMNNHSNGTYKNGTQVMFSMNESSSERCPRRYSSSVKPALPAAGNTTMHASQISNEWR